MADVIRTGVTAAEFLALPEMNQISELINGEIIVTPPSDTHQSIVGAIYFALRSAYPHGAFRIAPTGVHLDDENVVEPDVFWVSDANPRCRLIDGKYWRGAPDLVIEVLLPSTARIDRDLKFRLYEQYGVREYWLIDPDAQFIEVYRREGEKLERQGFFGAGETLTAGVLDGTTINVDQVFKV